LENDSPAELMRSPLRWNFKGIAFRPWGSILARLLPDFIENMGIVNLSEDRGKWPPFVALRKAQSPTCSGEIPEILFKLTIPVTLSAYAAHSNLLRWHYGPF